MSEIIDSYKKVFENKKAHIWLLLTAFLWTVMSTSFDIKFGNGRAKDNPIDLFFGFLIGLYSLQFLHNAIHNINNSVLPSIKEFNKNHPSSRNLQYAICLFKNSWSSSWNSCKIENGSISWQDGEENTVFLFFTGPLLEFHI